MSITGCRNDALVETLNQVGYQPIVLPLTGIEPPEVYSYKDESLTRRGPLLDYLPAGSTLPKLRKGKLAEITHRETSKKNGKARASFLDDALTCIGITSAPKLDLSFIKGHDVTFSFEDVTYEALDSSKIDHLLETLVTGAIAKTDIAAGSLYIAYDYAYSGKLCMRVASSGGASFNAKLIEIAAYVDLGVSGDVAVESETVISFASKRREKAAFACRLGRLEKRGKRWYFFPGEDPGSSFLADETEPPPVLLERGVVIRVEGGGASPSKAE